MDGAHGGRRQRRTPRAGSDKEGPAGPDSPLANGYGPFVNGFGELP